MWANDSICKKECNCQVIMFNWLIIIFGFRAIYMVEKHFLSKKYLFQKYLYSKKFIFQKKNSKNLKNNCFFSKNRHFFKIVFSVDFVGCSGTSP